MRLRRSPKIPLPVISCWCHRTSYIPSAHRIVPSSRLSSPHWRTSPPFAYPNVISVEGAASAYVENFALRVFASARTADKEDKLAIRKTAKKRAPTFVFGPQVSACSVPVLPLVDRNIEYSNTYPSSNEALGIVLYQLAAPRPSTRYFIRYYIRTVRSQNMSKDAFSSALGRDNSDCLPKYDNTFQPSKFTWVQFNNG